MNRPAIQLTLLAIAEVLAMSLWFSATAVLPSITRAWELSPTGAAWMTAAVQLGFVVGALGSAVLNLPDVIPPRRMFWASVTLGALANLVLAYAVSTAAPAIALRFFVGVCLAGVYPPGMKIAAGHVSGRSRGLAIGVLVGALTMGSATPHLVAGLYGVDVDYRVVLSVSSALALAAALVVALLVRDGRHAPAPAPFNPRQVVGVLRNRSVLLANCGYFGHMWELYGMWTWLVVFITMATGEASEARLAVFVIIGVAGGMGAITAGLLADRIGRTKTTIVAMCVSGACCLFSPVAYAAPMVLLILFGLIWGASIVADSAQFSAAVTELIEPSYMGTALTLQTSLGFALTLIPIWGLPYLAEAVGWRYAFLTLAPGPFLGSLAMYYLRRRPDAVRMAGGHR